MRKAFRETAETILIALVIAMFVRAFVVESFVVEGPSMEPTLYDHERLLVFKPLYRVSEPHRGDVIVFRYPADPRRDFVKRVLARGGETIEIRSGQVYVDGELVDEPYLADVGSSSMPPLEVLPGQLFVMGDNRSNSEDSRQFGFVPMRYVKGKAFLVYWPPSCITLLGSQSRPRHDAG